MLSFKSKQLREIEKNIIDKDSHKKFLLNSEKLKENNSNRNPSFILTSQENNKLSKSKAPPNKPNQSKDNLIIFKDYFNENKKIYNNIMSKKLINNNNNVKKALSLDKIGKNNPNDNNIKKEQKLINENLNININQNNKKEMNEIIHNFIENNLQNMKNYNFFRLFKMKRKNQNNNNNEKEIFPPLYGNFKPIETEQNAVDKDDNKYINLLTKQNEDNNNINYRESLINSVGKQKIKENRIFIKIDEHKLKMDKSPKIIKKDFQEVIKNIKTNNINHLMSLSTNSKNININNNNSNDDNNDSKQNYQSLIHIINYKNSKKNNINENNKTPKYEEKLKYSSNSKKKNRIKIKLNTPNSNNIYANKEEFNIINKNQKMNLYRKNTPNIFVNKIVNTIDIKNHNKKNKINFGFDIKKIKNKKIKKVEDNVLGDSFRDELNIIISDVNNCKKENINEQMENKKDLLDYSTESVDDDIQINLNEINYNDEIEKNIPKEQEERINLIKQYNRPETSYGRQKKVMKN